MNMRGLQSHICTKKAGRAVKFLTGFLTVLFSLFFMLICGVQNTAIAFAEEDTSIAAQYEKTNVWDNLQGAKIGGKAFNPSEYPYSEKDNPRIITLVEFCYSSVKENQEDYGLYVYVYNPQDLVFDTSSDRNVIQMKCGKDSYKKYNLEFLNYSKAAGYEGRFWKFKIQLSSVKKRNILNAVEQNGRAYEVSGITLVVKGVATEYKCMQKYTYSGFAKGYGSALAESDTLTCTVDGFEDYVELNVKQTCYRPIGDYYNGIQSQMNSCYFRVPEKFFKENGDLSKISCEWWEYLTKPILVTETDYLYQNLYNLHGKDVSNFNSAMRFLIMSIYYVDTDTWFNKKGSYNSFATNVDQFDKRYFCHDGIMSIEFDSAGEFFNDPTNKVNNFAAVFYAGKNKSYKDRFVTASELEEQLLTNSEALGNTNFHDRYSADLFVGAVDAGHTLGYNRKTIAKTDKQEIFWNTTTKSTWQTIFGGFDVNTQYDSVNAIVEVTEEDLKGSVEDIAMRLYVDEGDVEAIKAEFSSCKDERLVLFRYGISDYKSYHCAESYAAANVDNVDNVLVEENMRTLYRQDFTAYIAQETVYLDFDIISLWFTSDNVETEIPVLMSPQDVISGLSPPLDIDFHNENTKKIIALIIVFLAVVIILLLLYATGILPSAKTKVVVVNNNKRTKEAPKGKSKKKKSSTKSKSKSRKKK